MRREALRIRSTGRVSAGSVNSLILSPEEDCLGDKEKSVVDFDSEDSYVDFCFNSDELEWNTWDGMEHLG